LRNVWLPVPSAACLLAQPHHGLGDRQAQASMDPRAAHRVAVEARCETAEGTAAATSGPTPTQLPNKREAKVGSGAPPISRLQSPEPSTYPSSCLWIGGRLIRTNTYPFSRCCLVPGLDKVVCDNDDKHMPCQPSFGRTTQPDSRCCMTSWAREPRTAMHHMHGACLMEPRPIFC
jgi:hypothetical protein